MLDDYLSSFIRSYSLQLAADAEKMNFKGSVTVIGKKIGRPSQRLTLHQRDLKITSASIIKHHKNGTDKITISRINIQKTYDEVRLHTDEMLQPGLYTVTLEFSGTIKAKSMHGLYPCYFDHDGKHKLLLATQFESHYARSVFPCIDEPEAKATFDLTLETTAGLQVLSNTPITSQTKTSYGKQLTSFETTPIMSTYLLAFVIGEMHCSEAKTKDGIIVRTWASVAQPLSFTTYATKEAVDILEFLPTISRHLFR